MHWEPLGNGVTLQAALSGRVPANTHRLSLTMVLAVACLGHAGCDSNVIVGSGCKDALCPQVTAVDDCVVRSTERRIRVQGSEAFRENLGMCMPLRLPRDAEGRVALHVRWALPPEADAVAGSPTRCAELPYVHAVTPDVAAAYGKAFAGREICEVDQLPVPAGTDETTLAGTGFYYDDFSTELHEHCSMSALGRVAFHGTVLPDGVFLDARADEALDLRGKPDEDRICEAVGDTSRLGQQCLPPMKIYDESQTVLETRSASCGGGPCLAYHLGGNTDPDCAEAASGSCPQPSQTQCTASARCAKPASIDKLAFCSCRCAAPDPNAELCRCSEGFQCTPLIEQGDPAVVGSYCVRESIVVTP